MYSFRFQCSWHVVCYSAVIGFSLPNSNVRANSVMACCLLFGMCVNVCSRWHRICNVCISYVYVVCVCYMTDAVIGNGVGFETKRKANRIESVLT